MAVAPSSSDLERFRSTLGERLGLWLDDAKLPELSVLLSRRVAANGLTPGDYIALVEEATHGSDERRVLAQELTVTETFFFRQNDHLIELLEYLGRRPGPIAILSAGCASGEEPYSIAMLLRERLPQLAQGATIRAVDINTAMLERARAGVYSTWALRETPEATVQRWFRRHGNNGFLLHPEIRAAVAFQERNLIERNMDLLPSGTYDAVFFRNVLMYFTPRAQAEVIARIARALVPGGLLFLGYAETLRGLSTAFHLRHSRNTFFYQKRDGDTAGASASAAAPSGPNVSVELTPQNGMHWFDVIEQASARVRTLTEPRDASRPVPSGESEAALVDLDPTIELLRKERFGDALDTMQALPRTAASDPDVALLQAALLLHSGKLDVARATCTALLQRDELNAGAHYLLALISEAERDLGGAAEHSSIATYLDSTFAMPRLHLGLLARRRGDVLSARRELRHAYALIEREESARLVLFAGGFERSALLALCRAELTACGGSL
jgi:chemotaxis protein methyltransferase CheR